MFNCGKLFAMFVDGKKLAELKRREIKEFIEKNNLSLSLKILKEKNASSAIESFVKIKLSFAHKLGIDTILEEFENESTSSLAKIIQSSKEDGIILQLPVSGALDLDILLRSIPSNKDVDVLNPQTYKVFENASTEEIINEKVVIPPVALAVLWIIKEYGIKTEDKNIVVLGKGKLVGKPGAKLFEKLGGNVKSFSAEDKKDDVLDALSKADIVLSGTGEPELVKPKYVKEGVVLLDAGTSSSKSKNALVGDISLECEKKASIFSKTPGGIGPLTVAAIFKNMLTLRNLRF